MQNATTPPHFNLLLVENNPSDAQQLCFFLEKSPSRNYRVVWEQRMASALELLSSIRFDIVLLNLALPDNQGIETIRQFHERDPQVAIVILTDMEDQRLSVDAIRQGAQDYLLKKDLTAPNLDRIIGFAYERKGHQNQVLHEKSFLQTVIDGVLDPIMVLAPDQEILMYNRAAQITFDLQDHHQPLYCHQLMAPNRPSCRQEAEGCPLQEAIHSGKPAKSLQTICLSQGESRVFDVIVSPLKHSPNGTETLLKTWRDITVLHRNEQQLRDNETHLAHLAHHDPLTGLPNRLFLFDRLQSSIEKARRQQVQVAVLFADLDRFKEVNDTLGHAIGDLALKETADRFQQTVRKSDTVARLGGDEFVLIIEDPPALQDVIKVVRKLVEAIRQPYSLNGHSLQLTTSIGISIFPADGDRCDQLVEQADQAMLQAKSKGKNTFQFFQPEMENTAKKLGNLENTLRDALNTNQFRLYYQPRYDLRDHRITGIEALLRWQHPDRGLLYPEAFLAMIEDSTLIVEVGNWVIRQALLDKSNWCSLQLQNVPLAVNVASRQLRYPGFVGMVKDALLQAEVHPAQLELEFSESNLLYEAAQIRQLHQLGVTLAIDNFGLAPISLPGLQQLPCRRLSIDHSLTQGLLDDPAQLPLLRAAIAIGQSLNIPVVAKHIETTHQLQRLLELGCPQGQGFLYSRALPTDRLESSAEPHAEASAGISASL